MFRDVILRNNDQRSIIVDVKRHSYQGYARKPMNAGQKIVVEKGGCKYIFLYIFFFNLIFLKITIIFVKVPKKMVNVCIKKYIALFNV